MVGPYWIVETFSQKVSGYDITAGLLLLLLFFFFFFFLCLGSGLATDQEGWPLVVLGHTEQSNLWQFRRLCKKKFSPWATLTCIQVQKAVKRFYMLITAHFSGYEMTCLLATLSLASSFSGTATALWFTHREAFSISREHWTLRWRLLSSCPGHHRKDDPSRTNKNSSSSPPKILQVQNRLCSWLICHPFDWPCTRGCRGGTCSLAPTSN